MTDEQIHIIIQDEVGARYPNDEQYYNKKCIMPSWPGGDSGVTIGIGYDLGYNTAAQIQTDWGELVSDEMLNYLVSCAGLKGDNAKGKITPQAKLMRIPYSMAKEVFMNATLPRFETLAKKTYPGLDQLNDITQAVVVGLVYNRGASLVGDRRREMAQLVGAIKNADYTPIANIVEAMKRLWENTDLTGLVKRRIREAALIRTTIVPVNPSTSTVA